MTLKKVHTKTIHRKGSRPASKTSSESLQQEFRRPKKQKKKTGVFQLLDDNVFSSILKYLVLS